VFFVGFKRNKKEGDEMYNQSSFCEDSISNCLVNRFDTFCFPRRVAVVVIVFNDVNLSSTHPLSSCENNNYFQLYYSY